MLYYRISDKTREGVASVIIRSKSTIPGRTPVWLALNRETHVIQSTAVKNTGSPYKNQPECSLHSVFLFFRRKSKKWIS